MKFELKSLGAEKSMISVVIFCGYDKIKLRSQYIMLYNTDKQLLTGHNKPRRCEYGNVFNYEIICYKR